MDDILEPMKLGTLAVVILSRLVKFPHTPTVKVLHITEIILVVILDTLPIGVNTVILLDQTPITQGGGNRSIQRTKTCTLG